MINTNREIEKDKVKMIIDLIYRVAKWNKSSKGKLAKTKEWKQQKKKSARHEIELDSIF